MTIENEANKDTLNMTLLDGSGKEPGVAENHERINILTGQTAAYRLEKELGQGGMGRVFQAFELESGTICAAKVMHNHLKDSPENIERFKRETSLALSLNHENIVEVIDYGITDSKEPFLIMEYLEGLSLDEVLEDYGILALDLFFPIFSDICRGLQYAHDNNVVHRDIKPANIMLIPEGKKFRIKIVDFGIAKACASTGELCPTSAKILRTLPRSKTIENIDPVALDAIQDLTRPGEVFGSPLYMSPEQCYGEEADCRSEVYSLACMMFEALTGQPPLKGKTAMDTLILRINNDAPALNEIAPERNYPQSLSNLIASCLTRDPAHRIQSINLVCEELMNVHR